MIRYLLPKVGNYYKANLHSHSILSDGRKTPEEMKAVYKAHGYSVLAITDHEYMVQHNDLTEDDFLMLNGYEAYIKETNDPLYKRFMKTVHLNLIAKDPTVNKHIMVDPNYMKYALVHNNGTVDNLPRVGEPCVRQYTVGDVNRYIRLANENGYYVVYNHPCWSREVPSVITQYQGMLGIEVYNHGVLREGYSGDDARVYDEFLRAGRRMFAFANDDNHNKFPDDSPITDSFGGFNMIKAAKLDYPTIIAAIMRGDLYCSNGPLIDDLWLDDHTVHLTCPDAREAFLVTEGRTNSNGRRGSIKAAKGENLSHITFDLLPDDGYFRIEIIDHEGYKAFTRAYFLEDIFG